MKVLNNTTETEESCKCRNKNNCPLDGKCLTPNIIYEAQITSNQLNYKQKVYIGTTETDFKHRFNNHTKSLNLENYENDTELSKEYWTIKRKHFTPKVTLRIIRRCTAFNTTKRKCYLCLNEKLEIASYKGDNLMNKKSELISKCRHTKTNSLFYGMTARTKRYVFTKIFLAVFPLGTPFWPAQLMFCIYGFQNKNRAAQNNGFIGEYCGEYFL